MRVLGAFAAIAFLLAGIGIHGLLAFTVSQRPRRSACASRSARARATSSRWCCGQGAALWRRPASALGVLVAYAAGRAMQALLAGVSPADAATFLAAVGLALAMTLVGSLPPALRAVRVDPMTVMRAE